MSFKKIRSKYLDELISSVVEDILAGRCFEGGEFIDTTFIERVPLYCQLPKCFQIVLLKEVIISITLSSEFSKSLEKSEINTATYFFIFRSFLSLLYSEIDHGFRINVCFITKDEKRENYDVEKLAMLKEYEKSLKFSSNAILDEKNIFWNLLTEKFKPPEYYNIDRKLSEEKLEAAFILRKLLVNIVNEIYQKEGKNFIKGFKGVDFSHFENFNLLFWERIIMWIVVPYYLSISDSDYDLYHGELDREKDPIRFGKIRKILCNAVRKFAKSYNYLDALKSYYVLELFGYDEKFSEDKQPSKIVKYFIQKNEDENIGKLFDKGDKIYLKTYSIFHEIMIRKNRNYERIVDNWKSLEEVEDKDIVFPSKKIEVLFKVDIISEFEKIFVYWGARKCENCGKFDSVNKLHRRCSNCKSVYYCSSECQKKAWGYHKMRCKNQVFDFRELKKEKCGYCGIEEDLNVKLMTCASCRKVFYCGGTCQSKDWKYHKLECSKNIGV